MHLHGNKTRTSDDLHFVNVSENSSSRRLFCFMALPQLVAPSLNYLGRLYVEPKTKQARGRAKLVVERVKVSLTSQQCPTSSHVPLNDAGRQ